MTTPLHGLRTVIYPAPDLAAATTWWSQLLGFGPYFDEPYYVGFNVGGYELGLLPDGDATLGAVTYWGVDDVARAVTDTVAIGGVVQTPPADVGDGIITATIVTPDHSIVGFIFNPHFSPA